MSKNEICQKMKYVKKLIIKVLFLENDVLIHSRCNPSSELVFYLTVQ